jgi:transcriptional regulator with XRE-family HTH domain
MRRVVFAAFMPRRRDHPLLCALGGRIRQLRQARGLTQQVLATAVGVEPETVSRVETGSVAMSIANLGRVAQVLECSLADLFEVAAPVPPSSLTDGEREVLRLFRTLDARGQAVVVDVARAVGRHLDAGG